MLLRKPASLCWADLEDSESIDVQTRGERSPYSPCNIRHDRLAKIVHMHNRAYFQACARSNTKEGLKFYMVRVRTFITLGLRALYAENYTGPSYLPRMVLYNRRC
uniref:Uncharacterized protein n=1 Tax=viral metagenome TaxID=1070528 RepID=A0A6C0C0K4_9ZZZZ